MSALLNQENFATDEIINLITRERRCALSKREWQHRLAGYGYCIRDTDAGQVVETLPQHKPVCVLPAHLSM
ncbi:MAG: hypothetical protein ACSHWZ_00695 [Sulfitobacter sp.]